MKRTILVTLLLLSVTGIAAAYPNNYTLYVSYTSTDGNTLSGTAHITGNMLPPVPSMGNVLHTPQYKSSMGTQNYTFNWAGSCPTCDMNNYAYPGYDYMSDCGDIDFGCDGEEEMTIDCSVLGLFLNQGPGGNPVYNTVWQRAITISENTQTPIGDFGWVTTPECTPATSPPDFNFTALVNGSAEPPPPENFPYYKARSVCVRAADAASGTPWTCQPTFSYYDLTVDQAIEQFGQYGNGTKYNCTNRDKGYTGKPYP